MYAVIKSGGKQYRVATGGTLRLETLDAEPGATITFNEVLAIGDGADVRIGTPVVTGAVVTGTVLSHGRADKVMIVKFRRRKHSQKRQGHRQNYTEVRIDSIA